MKDIKIFTATHKNYRMPTEDIYFPLFVGAGGKASPGGHYLRDDTGDNISEKNANYCELTGLYWIWKNVSADYVGLMHYRRYFKKKGGRGKWKNIADRTAIEAMLETTDVILPRKRNYYIETIYSQHAHARHAQDLDKTLEVIRDRYPEYVPAFRHCMEQTSGHKCNLFIMKKELADAYCAWLFDILFELEKRLDISDYSADDARVFGYVSECIFDVWLEKNEIPFREMPVIFLEKQNWLVKGGRFLVRKVRGILKVQNKHGDNVRFRTDMKSGGKVGTET